MKRLLVPFLLAALIVSVMCYQAHTPDIVLADPPPVHLRDLPGFTSQAVEPSLAETNTLPHDTTIEKRLYKDPRGHMALVTVVVGGSQKGSIHRPELCLPSQGFLMTQPHSVSVDGTSWRFITLAAANGGADMGFAYTFFNQEGFHTSSHVRRIFRDVLDRSLYARIDRWVMVTVYTSYVSDCARAAFLRTLKRGLE